MLGGSMFFERERERSLRANLFIISLLIYKIEEATGDDLEHVPIDDLQYDIDVSEEMDSEADQ